MSLRLARVLVRHLWRVWRAGQLRFRLETFGVYYPAPQYAAPWWRVSPRGVALLLRQMGSYAQWVSEMEEIAERGGAAWWKGHRETGESP